MKTFLTALALAAAFTAAPAVAQQPYLPRFQESGTCYVQIDDQAPTYAGYGECFDLATGNPLRGVQASRGPDGSVRAVKHLVTAGNGYNGNYPIGGTNANYRPGYNQGEVITGSCTDQPNGRGNPVPDRLCQQGGQNRQPVMGNGNYGGQNRLPVGNGGNGNQGRGSILTDVITGCAAGAIAGDGNDWEDCAKGGAVSGLLGALIR